MPDVRCPLRVTQPDVQAPASSTRPARRPRQHTASGRERWWWARQQRRRRRWCGGFTKVRGVRVDRRRGQARADMPVAAPDETRVRSGRRGGGGGGDYWWRRRQRRWRRRYNERKVRGKDAGFGWGTGAAPGVRRQGSAEAAGFDAGAEDEAGAELVSVVDRCHRFTPHVPPAKTGPVPAHRCGGRGD